MIQLSSRRQHLSMHGRRLRINARSDPFSILFVCLNALCTNLHTLRPCKIHNLKQVYNLTDLQNDPQLEISDANDSQLHFTLPPSPFFFRIKDFSFVWLQHDFIILYKGPRYSEVKRYIFNIPSDHLEDSLEFESMRS